MATVATRPSRRQVLRHRKKSISQGIDEEFWKELVLQIRSSRLIPIISNTVRNDYILDSNFDGDVDKIGVPGADQLTIEEELATEWAEEIEYPLPDNFKLARVAQFNRVVKSLTDEYAKSKYLNFLKDTLLQIASNDETVVPVIESEKMWDRLEDLSFSHIAHELGYPKFNSIKQDSLRTLAKFPLPIYVTTSYYNFLERLLQGEGKLPQTQICFCSSDELPANLKEEHKPDPNLEPTVERPLVFHLFGLEDYPESLVLSEDDYFDFLVEFSKQLSEVKSSNQPPENRIIPPYLQGHLARSPLLLLGYRPQDWDFRVLFRGIIITAQETVKRDFGVAIQFDPEQQGIEDAKNAQTYLEKYFGKANFAVRWGNTDSFIKELWRAWNG